MQNAEFDFIIIGAGPAGLTAGIYLSRARMRTLIIDKGIAGGQMVLSHEIANYPGYDNIPGYQLGDSMRKQAGQFGCKIIQNTKIKSISPAGGTKRVYLEDGTVYTSKVLILATGGRARELNVEGEEDFKGRGISYCATCDGDFFTGKDVIVVGGGNSALEEAVALTKYAASVTVVHQFDDFQAFPSAVEEAAMNPKINFILNASIDGFYGDERLREVRIKYLKSGKVERKTIDGVFVLIGYVPNSELFEGFVSLSGKGEIITDEKLMTSVPGVFAAGDVRKKDIRQITTAVSDGTLAAINGMEYLGSAEKRSNA